MAQPISVAIVGAGPAGFYTAEALLDRIDGVRIDIIERLATPFGLIRAGVAPDHQSTKQVSHRFEQTALQSAVHFYGNVEIGTSVSLAELRDTYDAVVLATGSGLDRPLGIPGEQLRGVYGSAVFVGWYNGHPDFRGLAPRLGRGPAIVIGNGNVALDVARILVLSEAEMASSDLPDYAADAIRRAAIDEVHIVGRRGAADTKFALAELREIGQLEACAPIVDPADLACEGAPVDERERRVRERTLAVLRGFAAGDAGGRPKRLHFRFHLAPRSVIGSDEVRGIRFERTRYDGGRLAGTGETVDLPASVVVAAIGYRASPLDGVPFDHQRALFPSDDGRIDRGLYAVGWAKRGPTGVIGSNRPDGATCAAQIAADISADGDRKPGRPALERALHARGVRPITFDDWLALDRAEVERASGTAPRRKFTSLQEMLAALDAIRHNSSATGPTLEPASLANHTGSRP